MRSFQNPQLSIGQREKWLQFGEKLHLMLRDRKTTSEDIFELMKIPETAPGVEGTMAHEYFKSDSIRQAEFLRFRQRFVNDADCPVRIPEDFHFSNYMTLCISRSLEQVVEVGVYDWVTLWFIYLILYLSLAFTDYLARGGHMEGKNATASAFALIVVSPELGLGILRLLGRNARSTAPSSFPDPCRCCGCCPSHLHFIHPSTPSALRISAHLDFISHPSVFPAITKLSTSFADVLLLFPGASRPYVLQLCHLPHARLPV